MSESEKPEKPKRPATSVKWFVAVAQPGMDVRVAGDLAAHGYEVCLPKIWVRKSGPNYVHITRELRLSPYVFVAVDEQLANRDGIRQSVHAVRETLGVLGIVSLALRGDEMHMSEITAKTVRGLRMAEEVSHAEACKPPSRQKQSPYTKDDEVVVTAHGHPFEGLFGKVKDARNSSVIVLMGAADWPVHFDIGEISPANWVKRRRA